MESAMGGEPIRSDFPDWPRLMPSPLAARYVGISETAIEAAARACCNDPEAREIAGQFLAPAFDESEEEVQTYWRRIAEVALAGERGDD